MQVQENKDKTFIFEEMMDDAIRFETRHCCVQQKCRANLLPIHFLCLSLQQISNATLMMNIANPIYDTVFKYLMEDERIARTILSALLKENIVKVEVRPHEYSNGQKEVLSIFRIDFGATVRKENGDEQLILIELQKGGVQRLTSVYGGYPWLPTETLRFRQYLGVHYQNPKNIVSDSVDRHALPMVAVYLLGHTVGDIEEPVIYVRHQTFDYDEHPVTKGLPNAFVDSLNHNSIIVQIPRLHGKVNNHLDKILSIFDQTRVSAESQHYLSLDEQAYDSSDTEMQPILHRLLMAASSVEMRQDMNVEDEYYSIIKEQEGKVYGLERDLAEKETLLAEKDGQLAEKDGQLQSLVKMLIQAGQTIDDIAQTLHVGRSVVESYANASKD